MRDIKRNRPEWRAPPECFYKCRSVWYGLGMCFSPLASFTAGIGLSALGGVSIRKTGKPAHVPFAAIPFLFGLQQIIEGVVWISFPVVWLNTLATYLFTMFSHVLWPIYVPIAVLMLEQRPSRRLILKIVAAMGLVIGLYQLASIVLFGVTSEVLHAHIFYEVSYLKTPDFFYILGIIFYVTATVGSCLVSQHRLVRLFGVALALSFFITYQIYTTVFYSTWCFFAAILSVIVLKHVQGFRRR